MRSNRRTASALVVLLMVTLSASLSAQAAKDTGVDLKTHRFQPQSALSNASAASGTSAVNSGVIGVSALQQMSALLQDKKARTATQAKISSQLLYTARMLQGQPAAKGVPTLQTKLEVDDQNNLYVDITANVSDALLRQLRALGVRIIRSSVVYRSIRAFVPPPLIETIASYPDVIFISPKREATTWRAEYDRQSQAPWRGAPGFAQRAARLRQKLSSMLPRANGTGQGSVSSEGDVTHRANDARGAFGINGAGIKIGVLSDGVSSLADSQALGDLPPSCPAGPPCITVLPGQTGSGDEGTAMLEIVHDLAPGAQLYFATAFNSIESFAQNIRDLRTAGCDIIVDDVFYFVETPFQDGQAPSVVSTYDGGVVVQAVNDVTADGAMYFSSAGNSGNMDDSTSGSYEGDFVDGGANALLPGGTVHLFGATPYDTITAAGSYIFLHWSDPLGGSGNDYDLFILDPTGSTVVDASTDIQDGTEDPVEYVGTDYTGYRVVIFKVTGAADRFLHLSTNRGELAVATAGEVHGHAGASGAFAVAATPAYWPIAPGYPTGPYPNPFNATNVIEPYSSDGPRHIFFQADGTAITPGNFSSTGGTILQKPEMTGADGVSVTGVGGFGSPFYGTSAAAPHAAAIAALVKSAKAGLTNAEVSTALTGTAVDIMGTGVDRDSGAGILLAFEAVQSLGVSGSANPELGTVTATENPGNGDGAIEAGEGGKLVIQLKNTGGVLDATGITTTLTTTATGVTITQPNTSAYPDLTAGTGTATNQSPFTFTVLPTFSCGEMIDFTLTVTYTGGPSPRVLTFSVPTGPPPVSIATTLDTTAPPPVTGITTATGTQAGRLFRDGNPSVCGSPKPNPGAYNTTDPRQYDSYTFTACRNSCAEVSLSSNNAYALFSAMYSPSFTPGDTTANYAGDAGSSDAGNGSPVSYGVDTVAGTPYTVVVHEVGTGGGVGTNYTVQISGCSLNCSTPNQPPVARAKDATAGAGSTGTAAVSIDNGSSDPEGGPLTLTQTPPGPYSIGTTSVLLTVVDNKGATDQATGSVTVQDYVNPTLSDLTVVAGHVATQHITITPNPQFDLAITFACSLPATLTKTTCAFTTNPLPAPGTSAASTDMNITTTGSGVAQLRQTSAPIYATWLPLGALGMMMMVGVGARKRGRKALVALAGMLLIPLLLAIVSCGGSSHPTGTPAGTYAITVTATPAVGPARTYQFNLTVQ